MESSWISRISELLLQNNLNLEHMKWFNSFFAKVSILALCCTAAAVSCDQYDDTEIWDSIKELQEKVAALEKQVAENVAALQSVVTWESIKSCDFNTETGKVTITLLDGRKIVIDQTVSGYSLVTVVKDADGKYYWALCKDGKSEFLLVDGKKVPVSVTPDLKISDSGEWMITVDGGSTWIATGVFKDEAGDDASAVFFKNVEMEGDLLVLTLADGTVIKVAVVGDAEFSVETSELWFSRTSMTKSVAVTMNNVKSYTITEKPEGWKVEMDDSYLHVTSPKDFALAAKEGIVKVLALFEGGAQPEILYVTVTYEHPFSLSLNNDAVVVTMSEHTGEDFNGYLLSVWKESEFTPEAAVAWLNSEGYQNTPYSGNASYVVSDLAEVVKDENYIIFAVPYLPAAQVAQGNMEYEESDLQTIQFGFSGMSWAFSDIRYDYAHLNASFYDVESYYGGFFERGAWEGYGLENLLESLQYDGLQPCSVMRYDGPASAFPDNTEVEDLLPSTEYLVWMLPVSANKKYTAKDFITMTFTTPGITKDASIPAPEAEVTEITISGFTANVTPAPGAYKTYSAIYRTSIIPDNEAELVNNIIRSNNYSKGSEVNTVTTGNFDSKSEVCLLSVSVTEDGRYGEVLRQDVKIKELEYSDKLSVSVTDIQHGFGDVTLTLSFTGNPEYITYFAETFTFFTDEALQEMMALGQFGNAAKVEISKLEGGRLNISGLTVGALYTFYAVVSDAEGTSSYLYKYEFTPGVDVDYVLSSSADYTYGMPALSGTWNKTTYTLTADMPAECVKYWLFQGNYEYMTGDPWTDSDKLITLQYSGVTVHEQSLKAKKYTYMNKDSRIYMVWLDDKGSYHAIYEFDPQMPL